jgi:TPR repeat protein
LTASFYLSHDPDNDEILSPDSKAAEELLLLTAKEGNSMAQYILGTRIIQADIKDADKQIEGLEWIIKSAKQGFVDACDMLRRHTHEMGPETREMMRKLVLMINALEKD